MNYTVEELVSNGRKALEAVALLHERGYQGLRIKPGLSPSGAYWRLKIYNVFAPGVEYFRYAPQAPDKIWYVFEGKKREIPLLPGDSASNSDEITAKDIADAILSNSTFAGEKIADNTYNLWFQKLMEHVAKYDGLPIAYADSWDLTPGHWAIVGSDGGPDYPEPPCGYPVPEPINAWYPRARTGNYLSATWTMWHLEDKERKIQNMRSVVSELSRLLDGFGVDPITATLESDTNDVPMNWSTRYKNNQEKLDLGGAILVAQVIRDLAHRQKGKGLSSGEQQMLKQARELLITDISRLSGTSILDAKAKLDAITANY